MKVELDDVIAFLKTYESEWGEQIEEPLYELIPALKAHFKGQESNKMTMNLESMEAAVLGVCERQLGVEVRLKHLEDKIDLLLKAYVDA